MAGARAPSLRAASVRARFLLHVEGPSHTRPAPPPPPFPSQVAGIFFFYGTLYSDAQRELTVKPKDPSDPGFTFTAFMLLVQCSGNALFSLVMHFLTVPFGVCTPGEELARARVRAPRAALKPFLSVLLSLDAALVSFGYVFAMYSSNFALLYVSFPLQVLAKSCKMVPVMLGSILILGARFGLSKYLSVATMTAGVMYFQYLEPAKHGKAAAETKWFGPALLCASLALDGLSGPLQENMKKKYVVTAFQQNLISNAWAVVYMGLLTLALPNEWTGAVRFHRARARARARAPLAPPPPSPPRSHTPPPPAPRGARAAVLPEGAPRPQAGAAQVHHCLCAGPGLHLLRHPRVWRAGEHAGDHGAQALHARVH